jgi:hypothetical protein
MAQIWKQTTARETQGTKTEITKSATPVKSNKKKNPGVLLNQPTCSFVREKCHVSHSNLVDVLSTWRTRRSSKTKMIGKITGTPNHISRTR